VTIETVAPGGPDSRRRPDHSTDLGAGDRRCETLSFFETGDRLLRTVRRREQFGRHLQANAAFQATQQTLAKCAGGSGEDGAAAQRRLGADHEKEKQKGNANRATLAVARKIVAYLLAVDRGQREFAAFENHKHTAA
jgi:hypothetical protein